THPKGAEQSALEHVLGEHATVPAASGLFLDQTWRMHPDVCEFISDVFYDGRLNSEETCARQSLAQGALAGGSGLRCIRVEHVGNRSSSPEEAAEVARGLDALLGREWTDATGETRPLELDAILVVAPYNAQ